MQTSILWELSQVLKHNFFADIAAMLRETFTTDVPANTSKDELIASLQQQLNTVIAERDVLMKAFGVRGKTCYCSWIGVGIFGIPPSVKKLLLALSLLYIAHPDTFIRYRTIQYTVIPVGKYFV